MKEKVNIIIVAGQSNALGISPVAGLDELQRNTYENVRIFLGTNRANSNAGFWLNVRPGLGVDETRFGLEMGVAEIVSKKDERYAIVKYASDGTSLYDRWNAKKKESDYTALISTVKKAVEALSEKEIRYAGFLWMQGCNDACDEFSAYAYKENLASFIEGVRAAICEDMPFIIGQINPMNAYLPYRDRVIEAQKATAKEITGVRFVRTDDLLSLVDNYHYDSPCEWELGKRLAKELFNGV